MISIVFGLIFSGVMDFYVMQQSITYVALLNERTEWIWRLSLTYPKPEKETEFFSTEDFNFYFKIPM